MQTRRSALLGSAVLWAMLLAAPAHAGTIKVTTTADNLGGTPGTCSLREAVQTANTDSNFGGCADSSPSRPDTIKLAARDYKLTRPGDENSNAAGDLDVTETLAIAGAGAHATAIDGNGETTGDRVLQAGPGTILTLSGLTILGGRSAYYGGGVLADATVRLTNAAVTGNVASDKVGRGISAGISAAPRLVGGGISAGTAILTNATVSGNMADDFGGGIQAVTITLTKSTVSGNTVDRSGHEGGGIDAGSVTLTRSTVKQNKSPFGGGIYARSATLTGSTVRGNTATGTTTSSGIGGGILSTHDLGLATSTVTGNASTGRGGGIYASYGSVTVSGSTLAGNHSGEEGGGIFFSSAEVLELTNSTLSGNESDSWGGGLSVKGGSANLANVTINRNVADADVSGEGNGGGLDQSDGSVTMSSTIIAGNLDRSSAALFPDWNCNGGVYSQDHNLIGATDGCPVTLDPSDQSGTAANPLDPQLAPLASNGGPMRTSRLSATSPAVNAGDPGTPGAGGTPCEATDQRGVPRQLGGLCDIGAYERVTCHSRLVNVVGTSGSDSLEGSSRKDGILGLGGRDTLNGAGGKDGLCGGSGRDRLFGGSGNDFLDGGSGHDICDGGAGSDKSRRCEARLSIP